MNIKFPPAALNLLNRLAFVNILNVNYDAFSCYSSNSFDYVDTLILTTLIPPLVALIMVVLYYLESMYIKLVHQGSEYFYHTWKDDLFGKNVLKSKTDPSLDYCSRYVRAMIVFSSLEKGDAFKDAKEATIDEDIPVGTVEAIQKLSQIGEKQLVSLVEVNDLISSEMVKNRTEWKIWTKIKQLVLSTDTAEASNEDLLVSFVSAWKSQNMAECTDLADSVAAVPDTVQTFETNADNLGLDADATIVPRTILCAIQYSVLSKCCSTLPLPAQLVKNEASLRMEDVMKSFIEKELFRLENETALFEQLVDASVLVKEWESLCKYIRERFVNELVSKLDPELKEEKLLKLLNIAKLNDEIEHFAVLENLMIEHFKPLENITGKNLNSTSNIVPSIDDNKVINKFSDVDRPAKSETVAEPLWEHVKLDVLEKSLSRRLKSVSASSSEQIIGNRNTVIFILKELSILTTKQAIFTLRGRYVTLFLFMTYAILTTVSVTIGEAFGTIDINPGATTYSNSNYYLS